MKNTHVLECQDAENLEDFVSGYFFDAILHRKREWIYTKTF